MFHNNTLNNTPIPNLVLAAIPSLIQKFTINPIYFIASTTHLQDKSLQIQSILHSIKQNGLTVLWTKNYPPTLFPYEPLLFAINDYYTSIILIPYNFYFAAGLAALTIQVIQQPFNTVYYIQKELPLQLKILQYTQAFKQIYHSQGLSGIYHGFLALAFYNFLQKGIFLGAFHQNKKESFLLNICAAMTFHSLSSIVTYPIRLFNAFVIQTQGPNLYTKSFVKYQNYDLKIPFTFVLINILRNSIGPSLRLVGYDQLKSYCD